MSAVRLDRDTSLLQAWRDISRTAEPDNGLVLSSGPHDRCMCKDFSQSVTHTHTHTHSKPIQTLRKQKGNLRQGSSRVCMSLSIKAFQMCSDSKSPFHLWHRAVKVMHTICSRPKHPSWVCDVMQQTPKETKYAGCDLCLPSIDTIESHQTGQREVDRYLLQHIVFQRA